MRIGRLPPILRALPGCVALFVLAAGVPAEGVAKPDRGRLLGDEDGAENKCPGRAPPEAKSDAKKLTLLGVACFKEQQFARAYTFYHRAYEVEKSDLLRAAMGRSLHEIGIYVVAKRYYEEFLENHGSSKGRTKIERRLDQLRDDIEETGVKTRLASFPPEATVYVELKNGDWVELGRSPTVVHLRRGRYRFAYERSGYRRRMIKRGLDGTSGVTEIEARLAPADAAFNMTATRWKRAGLATALTSVPVLGVGAAFFGLAANKFNEANDYVETTDDYSAERQNEIVEKGHHFQGWAIGLTAVGAAGVLTGGILLLRSATISNNDAAGSGSTSTASSRFRPTVRTTVGPRFIGVRGRF